MKLIRYKDDIVVFTKILRAAKRLLESSRKFLEDKLKLRVNREKSKAISIYSSQFNFLSFRIVKNKDDILEIAEQSQTKAETDHPQESRKECPAGHAGD